MLTEEYGVTDVLSPSDYISEYVVLMNGLYPVIEVVLRVRVRCRACN